MKTIQIIISAVFAVAVITGCTESPTKESANQKIVKVDNVQVYYFHFTNRCVTCTKVENIAKEVVAGFNNPKVTIETFNLQLNAGKAKSKELGVSGQTLLIKAGEAKINVTNEAFLKANTAPEKLKQILQKKIQECLK